MAVIGNGAQSEFQALAFQQLVGITDLRLFDTDACATAKKRVAYANSKATSEPRNSTSPASSQPKLNNSRSIKAIGVKNATAKIEPGTA